MQISSIWIGERNGNPLQYSCLENPMNRGAWGAAVHGVTESQTQLKWLNSSSSIWIRDCLSTPSLPCPWMVSFFFFFNSFDHLQLFIQDKFISVRNISMSSGTVTTILVLQTNQCFSKSFPNVLAYQWALTSLLYLVILYFFA